MTADNASMEVKLRLRAYYLWEADGCPEGRLSEYWKKAQSMLDDEATIWAPVDEATAAGTLLTKRPHDPRLKHGTAPETGDSHMRSDASGKKS
ncbi:MULTISPECIES: DUF2934 domain-containing protein [Paraburkholderia]|jgi:hypothetical protein|uniref:DUF2934 domain-containing protein n=1 Tax=Paraburkholderia dipogonis TaxID=1211383 RepID=A0ABW9AYM6_9BURK